MGTTLDIHQCDPFRPPDWRWRRAAQLVQGRRLRPFDDEPTRRAVGYLRALGRAGTPRCRANLRRRMPDLAEAHALHDGDGPRRDELEARLLTDEPVEAIAAKTGTGVAALRVYTPVFFDVRAHLGATDWMMDQVLGIHEWPRRPLTERDCWLYLALAGGPVLVDLLVADHLGRSEPAMPDRHLWAQRVRWFVTDFAESRRSPLPTPQTIAQWEEHFGYRLARPPQTPDDRMLLLHWRVLRMAAGVRPWHDPTMAPAAPAAPDFAHHGSRPNGQCARAGLPRTESPP